LSVLSVTPISQVTAEIELGFDGTDFDNFRISISYNILVQSASDLFTDTLERIILFYIFGASFKQVINNDLFLTIIY